MTILNHDALKSLAYFVTIYPYINMHKCSVEKTSTYPILKLKLIIQY